MEHQVKFDEELLEYYSQASTRADSLDQSFNFGNLNEEAIPTEPDTIFYNDMEIPKIARILGNSLDRALSSSFCESNSVSGVTPYYGYASPNETTLPLFTRRRGGFDSLEETAAISIPLPSISLLDRLLCFVGKEEKITLADGKRRFIIFGSLISLLISLIVLCFSSLFGTAEPEYVISTLFFVAHMTSYKFFGKHNRALYLEDQKMNLGLCCLEIGLSCMIFSSILSAEMNWITAAFICMNCGTLTCLGMSLFMDKIRQKTIFYLSWFVSIASFILLRLMCKFYFKPIETVILHCILIPFISFVSSSSIEVFKEKFEEEADEEVGITWMDSSFLSIYTRILSSKIAFLGMIQRSERFFGFKRHVEGGLEEPMVEINDSQINLY